MVKTPNFLFGFQRLLLRSSFPTGDKDLILECVYRTMNVGEPSNISSYI